MDENEATIKKQLHNLIDWFAKQLPDSARATADLLKFAKMNDRRNYQLIRFCMAPESDYRIVHKAIVSHYSPLLHSLRALANLSNYNTERAHKAYRGRAWITRRHARDNNAISIQDQLTHLQQEPRP